MPHAGQDDHQTELNGLFEALIRSLREGVTPAPPWYLTHLHRWRWLIDTLMGHPLIRGQQRPRDFPTDPSSRRAVSCAVSLHKQVLGRWSSLPEGMGCPFGSWLYAYVLLVEGRVFPTCRQPDTAAQEALQWVIWQVLRITGRESDEGSLHRLLAALGMAPKDAPKLRSMKRPSGECKLCAEDGHGTLEVAGGCDIIVGTAAEAALIAGFCSESGTAQLPPTVKHNRKLIEALLSTPVWLITLKTHGVQGRIARAKRLFVTRGASVWISQALALGRELLLESSRSGKEGLPRLLLLTDVDALERFACFEEPECRSIRQILRKLLKRRIQDHNPRLAAFLASQGVEGKAAPGMAPCLPDYCIETDRGVSLLELCAARTPLAEADREGEKRRKEQEGRRCFLSLTPRTKAGPVCEFVKGDHALTKVNDVPWLEDRLANQNIGLNGLAWSLAGGTYLADTLQGLGESLGYHSLVLRNLHGDRLRCLGESERGVAYLKLDGDQVGLSLGSLPRLRSFPAGLDIFDKTQEGLLQGIRSSLSAWNQEAPLPTLPIELVYLGGDDVMCSLPERYVEGFLFGFERTPKPVGAASFSGVVLQAPPALGKELGEKIPEVASSLIPKCLKWMKSVRRGEIPRQQGSKETIDITLHHLQQIARDYGFWLRVAGKPEPIGPALTLWRFDLVPSDGAVPLLSRAQQFAMDSHTSVKHLRKYTREPYSNHLAAVADCVEKTLHATEEMIAAAWLHDVLEDVPSVSMEHLEREFGPGVASLVLQLTDVSRPEDGNRAVRKAKDRDHLAKASPEAQTIKLADLLDNADAILSHDPAFANVFLKEMGDLLGVLTAGDAALQRLAGRCLTEALGRSSATETLAPDRRV